MVGKRAVVGAVRVFDLPRDYVFYFAFRQDIASFPPVLSFPRLNYSNLIAKEIAIECVPNFGTEYSAVSDAS
jgi:hypothetical protein